MGKYKPMKELYRILYDYMNSSDYNSDRKCICGAIFGLYANNRISFTERLRLVNKVKENKPSTTKRVRFFKHPNFIKDDNGYWWVEGAESWEQRKLFVKKLGGIK